MSSSTDLMGLGMPPYLAAKLGYQPSTVVAVGTTQAGAPTILSKNATINATSSAQAVVLPISAPGDDFWLFNPGTIGSAGSALVFVPSGHTLFAAGNAVLNGGVTISAATAGLMFQSAIKQWYVVKSA